MWFSSASVALATAAALQVAAATAVLEANSINPAVAPLYELVERQMPRHKDSFLFTLTEQEDGSLDSYTVKDMRISPWVYTPPPYISVTCNTIPACAKGLHRCVSFLPCVDIYDDDSNILPDTLLS